MKTASRVACVLSLLGVTPTAQAPARSADLVLRGGKIVTVDDTRPVVEAIAVTGDTIVAIGPNAEIQRLVGPATRVIDLKGALAIPGLIDAHAHFTGVGEAARNLKLGTAKSWDDIVAHAAAGTRLRPGDVLGSGTLARGCILELGIDWLTEGDVVTIAAAGLGELTNMVA